MTYVAQPESTTELRRMPQPSWSLQQSPPSIRSDWPSVAVFYSQVDLLDRGQVFPEKPARREIETGRQIRHQ